MGIILEELDSKDMLDVIHYLFEEDALGPSGEYLEARSALRENIYGSLYRTNYKYKVSSSAGNNYSASHDFDREPLVPFDPSSAPTKGYMPPSDFDPNSNLPFGSALEPPMS